MLTHHIQLLFWLPTSLLVTITWLMEHVPLSMEVNVHADFPQCTLVLDEPASGCSIPTGVTSVKDICLWEKTPTVLEKL